MLRLHIQFAVVLAVVTACGNGIESGDPGMADVPDETSTVGGEDTTYDHDNSGISPWELIDRLTQQGPPKYTSRVHGCAKVRYRTLGNVLRSVGVNVANTASLSAGELYRTGYNALGGASYPNRIRENLGITTSGASREFDIFAAAADEIIAAVPTLERCRVGDAPAVLFDGDQCRAQGITCLIGVPAQQGHLDLCNLTVSHASNPAAGKRLAVAALMSAAYTCE
ncbi:MAG: hypothetical protein AB7P03_15570 [Kofleriaceae bacterium]